MISFDEDAFIKSNRLKFARWEARLSNGKTVLMDDGRPECKERSAWLRLSEYCKQEKVNIVGIDLKFRTNKITPVPDNMPGYFFRKNTIGFFGKKCRECFLIGYLCPIKNKVVVQRWVLPALTEFGKVEERNLDDEKLVGTSLIINNYG